MEALDVSTSARLPTTSTQHSLQSTQVNTSTTMSSASKAMPMVRQLALTATRPSALHTLNIIRATSPRVFNALTASARQQQRHASQLPTTSNATSMTQEHPPEIMQRLKDLEKSHAATQLENKKQWQHLYRVDEVLVHPTTNTARPTQYDVGLKAAQDAVDNSESCASPTRSGLSSRKNSSLLSLP